MMRDLKSFSDKLYGCRFCPMCKPAGEVSNLTQIESHTTKSRAQMLWRIANDMLEWQPRGVELLYQSTLDSISEAWCVNHYPVSGYMLAARAEVFAAGLAPQIVHDALDGPFETHDVPMSDALLLGGEAAQLNDAELLEPAVGALAKAGVDAAPWVLVSGALAYSLGAVEMAREQAQAVVDAVRQSGAQTVIADGPQTLWALRRVYPDLGIEWPGDVTVTSVSEALVEALAAGDLPLTSRQGERVFVHDSRAAMHMADALPLAETIQPGYTGDEANLGQGAVYDAPRQLIDALGMQRQYSVWSRALSRSSGADDGLSRTFPHFAEELARARLTGAQRTGASMIVADSLLDAVHLHANREDTGITVEWLPALVAQ